MTPAFPYDAVETDAGVCVVAVCPPPPAREVSIEMISGRGLEIACGRWRLRLANLHPVLEAACLSKPVSVAAVGAAGPVLRGPGGIAACPWREPAFLWYLDVRPTSAGALAARPLARAIGMTEGTVVIAALGSAPYGPPVALCATSRALAVLPPWRVWHRISRGLLADQSLMDAAIPTEGGDGGIAERVAAALSTRVEASQAASAPTWRPQLAMLASTA